MVRQAFFALLTIFAPLWSSPTRVADPVAPFRTSIIAGSRQIGPAAWSVGHARIFFSGAQAPILVDGHQVGFALEGEGRMELHSAFVQEAPVLRSNLAEWAKGQATPTKEGLELTVSFTRGRFTWLGAQLPPQKGEDGPSLAATMDRLAARFRNLSDHDPFQLQALQLANAPNRPLVIAELESATHRWVYIYDGFHKMEETLDLVVPDESKVPAFKDLLHPIRISRQAIGWDPTKGSLPPPFLITHLKVDLSTVDNHQASVLVEETLMPMVDGQRLLRFRLMDELRTAKEMRHLTMGKVVDEQGRSLPFNHAGDRLVIQLETPTTKGQVLKLKFDYSGDFLIQPGGDNYWELPVSGGWYPQSETLAGESYSFHGVVRTPGQWIAFLPGDTVSRHLDGGFNVVDARTDHPICFATILAGKYSLEEEKRDGLTVRIATYGHNPGVGSRVLKDQAFNVIRYYQTFLGPFPFTEFQIVEKNAWGYGQAPPGMMYITSEAFNQHTGLARFFRQDLRKRFAHEIAHQYWGIVVKMPSPEEQWLTESFAEYCAGLYERDFKSEGRYAKNLAVWKERAREATEKAPIPLANDLRLRDSIENFKARTFLLYDKGPVLLASLHQEIGDQLFLTFLKSAQASFRWRFTTTHRMFDLLKFITKKDYSSFSERYFWGLAVPDPSEASKHAGS